MSMPPSSRPSRCCHDGWPNTGPTCSWRGYGAIHGARIAVSTQAARNRAARQRDALVAERLEHEAPPGRAALGRRLDEEGGFAHSVILGSSLK